MCGLQFQTNQIDYNEVNLKYIKLEFQLIGFNSK